MKEMDPVLVRKLLEGEKDVLSGEVVKEEALFRHLTCPVCRNSSLSTQVSSVQPFQPGALLPNKHMVCDRCKTEFDPITRFIIKAGGPLADLVR